MFIKHFILLYYILRCLPPVINLHRPHGSVLYALGVEEACIFGMRHAASHYCSVRANFPCWAACVGSEINVVVAQVVDLLSHLVQLFGLRCVGIH